MIRAWGPHADVRFAEMTKPRRSPDLSATAERDALHEALEALAPLLAHKARSRQLYK